MVEKWIRANKMRKYNYPMPSKLFKDSDGDGVPDVFDCSPHNKRKQDVIAPFSGGNPMMDMWNRQENSRRLREQQHRLNELQRLEEQRLKELQRLANVTVVDKTSYIDKTQFIGSSGGKVQTFNTQKEANDYEDKGPNTPIVSVFTSPSQRLPPKLSSGPIIRAHTQPTKSPVSKIIGSIFRRK